MCNEKLEKWTNFIYIFCYLVLLFYWRCQWEVSVVYDSDIRRVLYKPFSLPGVKGFFL